MAAAREVCVQLPERLAGEVDTIVGAGWFQDEAELVRQALSEFVRRHRFELSARFQREDIAWALEQKRNNP